MLIDGPQDGPLVLCLHGFPDIPLGWAPVMTRLAAAGYRVVAPWMRGYAPSPIEGPYDVASLGADVLRIADALSPAAPVRVLGHDWGAMVVYPLLAARPDRFASAVTLAVPHPFAIERNILRHPSQFRRSGYIGFFQLRGLADAAASRDDFALVEGLWRRWSPDFDPGEGYWSELRRCFEVSAPAPLRYYRALWHPRSLAYLRRVLSSNARKLAVPTMYLRGARDGCMSADMARGQEAYFGAGFEQVTLEGTGHFAQIERPDEVTEHALRWFEPARTPLVGAARPRPARAGAFGRCPGAAESGSTR